MSHGSNGSKPRIEGTVVVEAAPEPEALVRQFEEVLSQPGIERAEVLVVCLDHQREATEAALACFPTLRVIEPTDLVLREVRTDKLAFVPCGNSFSTPLFAALPDDRHSITILPPAADFETNRARNKMAGWPHENSCSNFRQCDSRQTGT